MSDDSRLNLPPFPSSYRASGLLLHVTSLPSRYRIGDAEPSGAEWIDRLSDAAQSWWQALPLGPTGRGNSPYQSLSSFAGHGILISLTWLIQDGLLHPSDCPVPAFSQSAADYNTVMPSSDRNGRGCVMTPRTTGFLEHQQHNSRPGEGRLNRWRVQ